MRFFEPSKAFLDWLAAYAADRPVIDVGCGEGHIILELQKRGAKACGIDPRYRVEKMPLSLINCVFAMPASECRLLRTWANALVLFCRPCHSGFVAEALDYIHYQSEILYISRPRNLKIDLKLCGHKVQELTAPPCSEEKVYQVRRNTL